MKETIISLLKGHILILLPELTLLDVRNCYSRLKAGLTTPMDYSYAVLQSLMTYEFILVLDDDPILQNPDGTQFSVVDLIEQSRSGFNRP